MNREGALLLILADRLNGYNEGDIRHLCYDRLGLSDPNSVEVTYRILHRWIQLDKDTRHKILKLVSAKSITGEENDFTQRINSVINSIKPIETEPNKGQQNYSL